MTAKHKPIPPLHDMRHEAFCQILARDQPLDVAARACGLHVNPEYKISFSRNRRLMARVATIRAALPEDALSRMVGG